MKKILPALLPFALIGALILVLTNTDKLKAHFSPAADTPSPATDSDLPPAPTSPRAAREPNLPAFEHTEKIAPKAVVIEEEVASLSYPPSQYPFVNKPFKWKTHESWTHKYTVSFNSDGSVTQNFRPKGSLPLTWWPNHNYSLILSDNNGWTIDVVFNAQYNTLTGRRRGQEETYSGKKAY